MSKKNSINRAHDPRILQAAASATARTMEMTCAIDISAEAAPQEGQKAGPRKFSMIAYTGGPMQLSGYYSPVVVDLNGVQGMSKPRPIFRNHDLGQLVGHTDSIQVQGGKIIVSGFISGASAAASEVLAANDNGFPWQASIGARVLNMEFVKEGSKANANGSEFSGPVNIARKTVLGEISFVPLGADDNTSARIAASPAKDTPMTFEQWLEAKGFVLAELTDAQKQTLKAAFDAEIQAISKTDANTGTEKEVADAKQESAITAAAPAADLKARREAEAAEVERVASIRVASAEHPKITAQAIREGWSIEKTELEVLRASRPTGGPYFNTGAGLTPDLQAQAMGAALCRSAGVSEKVAFEGLPDNAKDLSASKQFRGMGMHQAMFAIAAASGLHFTPGKVDDNFLRAMLIHDQQMQIRAADGVGFSTMSLSGITENILNKAMLEAYSAVASVVEQICFQTDTNDFKQYKRYRLTGSGVFAAVNQSGELKNMTLQDENYANQVKTQGAIIQIGREILINDDMGALVQVPQIIGRQAAISREKAVFTALLANTGSFFGTGNKNYLSGAGSALSISALTSAEQKFLEMKDVNGDPILVAPDRILVPPALKTTATNLFNGALVVVGALGSTSSKVLDPNSNPHVGKYTPIASPYLGTQAGLSGASDTGWYLLTNPAAGFATAQIGYLRGQRTPIIERGEANFNQLGIAFRGYYDFGVALHDFRCGVLNAGA